MNGLNATLEATGADNKALLKKSNNIENSAAEVIATILSFVGVAFLILMIYGGVLWMISQGEPAQVKKAKDIIINGIIGLVIVVFAYAITSYLGSTLTS
jgi:TRAP-type C4-dicarboxylate transport system permease small subunit